MAVEKITLNLIPTGETPIIHAAQFDKEREFQIELKEGEDDFNVAGYDIELQVRKVDSNIVTAAPSTTSGNVVTFLTTEQMTACSGTNIAELEITKDSMSIATLHFYIIVQRNVLAGGLTSQSEIHDLEEQIAAIVPSVIGDEYYTAEQVDEKIAEIPTFDPTNYYDKTQLYTKTETNGLLSQKANTSALSTVAFTGSYDDLVDHPVIPDVSNYYTKSETYNQTEVNNLLSTKADTSSLSSVATSGSYDDLSNKPTIPGNATELPISASDSTNTKDYIDNAISGLVIPNKIITESLITATTLTTTSTDYNTYSSRKFSDYDLLVFKIGYGSDDCRKSVVIPQNNWYLGASIIDQIIHGASVSTITSYEVSNFTITYKSDTSITAIVGGSGVMNKLRVYGLRLGTL